MEQVNVGRHQVPEPSLPHLPQCWAPRYLHLHLQYLHLRSAAPGRTRRDRGHQEDNTQSRASLSQHSAPWGQLPRSWGCGERSSNSTLRAAAQAEGLPAHRGSQWPGPACVPAISSEIGKQNNKNETRLREAASAQQVPSPQVLERPSLMAYLAGPQKVWGPPAEHLLGLAAT